MKHISHKTLVDAIVDAELDTAALAKRSTMKGPKLAAQFMGTVQAILSHRVKGTLTADQAIEALRTVYISLSLGALTEISQEVLDRVSIHSHSVLKAMRDLGPELLNVEPIEKADFDRREAELGTIT